MLTPTAVNFSLRYDTESRGLIPRNSSRGSLAQPNPPLPFRRGRIEVRGFAAKEPSETTLTLPSPLKREKRQKWPNQLLIFFRKIPILRHKRNPHLQSATRRKSAVTESRSRFLQSVVASADRDTTS